MADARSTDALALAEELERRDAEYAAAIAQVAELAGGVDDVRAWAAGVHVFLEALPGELERLERAAAEAREAERQAFDEQRSADERLRELGSKRRPDQAALASARSAAVRSREAVDDAQSRVERLEAERQALLTREQDERAGVRRLAGEAQTLAARLRLLPRLSEAGRSEPGSDLEAVLTWGERAHAALLLARGGLDAERERTVREANELGSVMLGEPLGASSVAVVRQRLARELGG